MYSQHLALAAPLYAYHHHLTYLLHNDRHRGPNLSYQEQVVFAPTHRLMHPLGTLQK